MPTTSDPSALGRLCLYFGDSPCAARIIPACIEHLLAPCHHRETFGQISEYVGRLCAALRAMLDALVRDGVRSRGPTSQLRFLSFLAQLLARRVGWWCFPRSPWPHQQAKPMSSSRTLLLLPFWRATVHGSHIRSNVASRVSRRTQPARLRKDDDHVRSRVVVFIACLCSSVHHGSCCSPVCMSGRSVR